MKLNRKIKQFAIGASLATLFAGAVSAYQFTRPSDPDIRLAVPTGSQEYRGIVIGFGEAPVFMDERGIRNYHGPLIHVQQESNSRVDFHIVLDLERSCDTDTIFNTARNARFGAIRYAATKIPDMPEEFYELTSCPVPY